MKAIERGSLPSIAAIAALAAFLLAPAAGIAAAAPSASSSSGPGAGAEASPFAARASIDWIAGLIKAEVELDLGAAGIRLPSGRSQAERSMESATPGLVRETALSVDLDSYRTVADSLLDGTLRPEAFEAFLEAGRKTSSSLSRDLGRLVESYEWRLADLAALYVMHSAPVDMPRAERYAPTRAYTGIIVFAQGDYPVRGEHRTGKLRPSLFPRLYDEAMAPIVERNQAYPDSLRSWGAVGFAAGLDDPVVEARAGIAPLRIIASQIFGSKRTDAVISVEDALKILGSPENRELARQGRVVFVIDAP
ncbi:MAG: hypothetical protein KKA67_01710 [Spirochaetes bacterium]|nr:hypothetical protein [Spirochaetota bacterium]MBU1080834.1 hypothetical protein [Spirochaetota bacterium]